MQRDTRAELLDAAESLFAARGFDGVSIAAIAGELTITKQALLHHFGSKEKLYGTVLARISADYRTAQKAAINLDGDAATQLKSYLMSLAKQTPQGVQRTSLIMRELLDNNERAEAAENWYLRDFLTELIAMLRAIPAKRHMREAEALAVIYQLLGAINYFAVSRPTLTGIFGSEAYQALDAAFPKQLETLIDAMLAV